MALTTGGGIFVGEARAAVTLDTSRFAAGIKNVQSKLQGLAQQAGRIGNSFRFIGGAVAITGLAAGVAELVKFEDALLGLKGALSGTIKDQQTLSKNTVILGKVIRGLALESGFAASEIAASATSFARAGISAKQTQESLRGVIALARAEGDDLSEITDIAIDISKGFRVAAGEFDQVADILVNASLASNVTIRQLGETFKVAAGISKQFNQSFVQTAALAALLADRGQKATISGTALRQVLVQLERDANNANGVLRRFNISLFKGGEIAREADSEYRPLADVLQELGAKTKKTGDFIQIFQARTLTAANSIAREDVEAFGRLVEEIGRTGTAAQVAAIRSQSLATQLGRLKASVNEVFLALGFEGGLLQRLKQTVDGIRAFFTGLGQINPELLKFASAFLITVVQLLAFGAAIVAVTTAVGFLISPLGRVLSGLLALTTVGKGLISVFDEFKDQFDAIKTFFQDTFALAVNKAFELIIKGVRLVAGNIAFIFEQVRGDFLGIKAFLIEIFTKIANGATKALGPLEEFNQKTGTRLSDQIGNLFTLTNRLAVSTSGLAGDTQFAAAQVDRFSTEIAEAESKMRELETEFLALQAEGVPLSSTILAIGDALRGLEGSEAAIAAIQDAAIRAADFEERLAATGGKNINEILKAGGEIAAAQERALRVLQVGDFTVETEELIRQLEELKFAAQALESPLADSFDEFIARVKASRAEIKALEDAISIDLLAGVRSGIQQVVSGILQGTRETISGAEILRNLLLSTFTNIFTQILEDKLKFDVKFKNNFEGLGQFVRETFSSIAGVIGRFFGGGTPSSGGAGVATSAAAGIAAFFGGIPGLAAGGIVTGPTLAMLGEGGSREVVIPLDEGGLGTKIVVNNFAVPPDQIQVREMGVGLNKTIEVIVGKVLDDPRLNRRIRQDNAGLRPRVER